MQSTAVCSVHWPRIGNFKKILLLMKLTIVLLLATCLLANARGYSQSITLSEHNVSLQRIFKAVGDQTGYNFFYRDEWLDKSKRVSIKVTNASLEQVMLQCLQGEPLTYSVVGNTVVIKQKTKPDEPKNENLTEAQTIEIRGTVTDDQGRPIQSVSVVVPGTPLGSVTDARGEYSIKNAPENADLLFSYIGYENQRVHIGNRRVINAILKQEIKQLDETVVIGYGTTSKRKNTGSVSTITAEEIAKQPVANPLNALQGRVAGALVTQANGLPGSRVTIQIRGVNSIDQTGAGIQPLFIVDGVPFNIYNNSTPVTNDLNSQGQFAAAGGLSPFNLINPADIESISVLKDADATAIYGTRGANGVVLITTKKGKAGKTKPDVNVYQGAGRVGHYIPMMNTQQYLQMRKEAFANDGVTATAGNAPDLLLWDQNAYTDWQKKYLGGTANVTDAQTTVSGGDARTRFLLNAGYHRETPVFPGDYQDQRVATRLNVDHNSLDRKFNANVSLGYTFENTNLLSQDLSTLYNLPPNMPLYNPDGSLYWLSTTFTNPDSYLFVNYLGKTHNLIANSTLRYTILPGLDLKTSFGFTSISLDQNTQNPSVSKNPNAGPLTNTATFANVDQRSYILEPQATYTRNISKGKLSALLGGTFQHSLNTALRFAGSGYPTATLLGSITGAGVVGGSITTSTGQATGVPGYNYALYRYNSVFGRLTYDRESKYLLNAVVRRDGSTRFGPGKRFGTFWSLGAGWVFTKENFAAALPFLSFGKLRGSYGLTGNDQIPDYQYRAFFVSSGTYQNNTALAPNRIDNPLLHWQNTYKLEFGLDLAFLKERIQLTTNYYRNRTPDQLGFLQLSAQAGFNSYASNFDALIQNTGLEFELNTSNVVKKNFRWSTSFNVTVPRTKLISASPTYFFYNQSVLGKPLSAVFRFAYRGVDPATGNPLYKNLTADTSIRIPQTPNFSTDRSVIGFSAPEFYGGINNVIAYKALEFSFFFHFQKQEGNIFPSTAPGVLSNGNQPTFWLARWTKPGEATNLPRYTTSTTVYSAYASSNAIWGDASFLRLRTVNLSYSLPKRVTGKLRLDNARIYLQAQNLWWTSKNKYVYDPETGTAMPPLRVITAGVNVSL